MPSTHRVRPNEKLAIDKISTNPPDSVDKKQAEDRVEPLLEELYELQELLYAAGSNSLLIVLQGLDTSGKDGAIRCLSRGLNMQGTKVASFKAPTPEELGHDFLWRIHREAPGKGQVVVYNRSHYEDVLVVRVHRWVSEQVWMRRYEQIREYEELLAESGTIIVKFMLHISNEEQARRLKEREEDPIKAWKLNPNDWKERELWPDYIEAYQDALTETSVDAAPWHVVPSDKKWFRNLAIVESLVETLRPYRKEWEAKMTEMAGKRMAELASYRASITSK